MVVIKNDELLIITNCDQKFSFFCNFMANCVKVSQNYFNNIVCPSKVKIGNGGFFEKSNINISMDPVKFEEISGKRYYCPTTDVITYSDKCIEYGLVLYEHKTIRLDTRWPLEKLITDFNKNPPLRDSYFFVGTDLDTMIKTMINIRTNNFDSNRTDIFPIYNVGTCNTSKNKTNDYEFLKLMYFMFIAGIYNFFEILKEILLRKYKNELNDKKDKVIFEALQRMYIQVNEICDSIYKKTNNESIHNGIFVIKEQLTLEYQDAFLTNVSLNIDYSRMCLMPYASSSNDGGYNLGTVLGIAGLAGLGIYGLKKWHELKGVSSSSSSSSSWSDSSSSSSDLSKVSKVQGVGRGRGRGRGRGKSSVVVKGVRQSARLKAASGKKGRVTVRAKSSGEVKGVRQSARLKAAADLKGASKSARLKSKRV